MPGIDGNPRSAIRNPQSRRACILCPGPSLAARVAAGEPAGYDIILAVNRAAAAWEADYWVMLDHVSLGICSPVGEPVIITSADQHKEMIRRFQLARVLTWLDFEQLAPWSRSPGIRRASWRDWSLTVAVASAVALGADLIDCLGVDWAGRRDWDGFQDERMIRNEHRWERERKTFGELQAGLAAGGIVLSRANNIAGITGMQGIREDTEPTSGGPSVRNGVLSGGLARPLEIAGRQ